MQAAQATVINSFEISARFKEAMLNAGIGIEEEPIADGVLHRFDVIGDRKGSKNGWYVLYSDEFPGGAFGSWKQDINQAWSLKNDSEFTEQERADWKRRIEKAKKEQQKVRALAHKEARADASHIWEDAKPETGEHQYLKTKEVKAYGIRTNGHQLIIPLRDTEGIIRSLQFIYSDGKKRFLSGGTISGHYFGIGELNTKLVIVEGYSTGASIHKATGIAVAVAFNCGNLLPVAKALHAKHPEIEITIAGDNDQWTENNPGQSKAMEAAKATKSKVVIPDFKNIETKPTDFNDLFNLEGSETVKMQIDNAALVNDVKSNWPDPDEIKRDLIPVEPFPKKVLPDVFFDWAEDVSDRMQAPIDYVAAAAIVEVSSIIGTGCGVKPKANDNWMCVPNLWGAIIGRPGVLKTPSINEALKPLKKLEALAMDEHQAAIKNYEAEQIFYDAELKKAKKELDKSLEKKIENEVKGPCIDKSKEEVKKLIDNEPNKPNLKRYRTNDTTIEKLAVLVEANPRGVLVERDELTGLFNNWEKPGRESDRQFFLEAWNGNGSHIVDRMSRETVRIQNLCVSVVGGLQPTKLVSYLRKITNFENDGLIQRLQVFVYPDVPKQWKVVDKRPNKEAESRVFEVIKKLAEADFVQYGAEVDDNEGISYFRFDASAQALFFRWLQQFQKEKLHADEAPIITEHLAKYRSLVPSLALVFHLIDVVCTNSSGPISEKALRSALAYSQYLESHARRIYSLAIDPRYECAVQLSVKLLNKQLTDGFSVRDVRRKEWHLLTDMESIQAACNELEELDWILRVQEPKSHGKGAKTIYLINPKIYG